MSTFTQVGTLSHNYYVQKRTSRAVGYPFLHLMHRGSDRGREKTKKISGWTPHCEVGRKVLFNNIYIPVYRENNNFCCLFHSLLFLPSFTGRKVAGSPSFTQCGILFIRPHRARSLPHGANLSFFHAQPTPQLNLPHNYPYRGPLYAGA